MISTVDFPSFTWKFQRKGFLTSTRSFAYDSWVRVQAIFVESQSRVGYGAILGSAPHALHYLISDDGHSAYVGRDEPLLVLSKAKGSYIMLFDILDTYICKLNKRSAPEFTIGYLLNCTVFLEIAGGEATKDTNA